MLKNRYIKFCLSFFLLLLALWIATPKVYVHALLNHDHSNTEVTQQGTVVAQSSQDCDFENYNKPVFFNLFKFICSFLPERKQRSEQVFNELLNLRNISYAVSLLRGPPAGY
jgi:hypothetical protein